MLDMLTLAASKSKQIISHDQLHQKRLDNQRCKDREVLGFQYKLLINIKVRQSCYRPGVAQRVPGS